MFVLSSVLRGLEFWSVNHTSVYESSESNSFKNIKFLREIYSDWPNNLLGINVYKSPESCW